MTLREVLNKIFWNKNEKLENYEVTFIHRGAYMNRKQTSCDKITKVASSYFTYENNEVVIPFHRVIEVRNSLNGFVVWRKRLG